jgi:murein DD-endopeptidase MepM/ murein hydrolase activator NlpD
VLVSALIGCGEGPVVDGTGGGSAGGSAGGAAGGAAGGTAGGSAGGTAGGSAGGAAGGAAGGRAGGSAGGTAGGSAGGTAGGSAGGTAGGSAGGTAGGSAGGTAGGAAGGSAGGAAGGNVDGGILLSDGGCNAAAFARLVWPLPGTDSINWVINNYVDLDTTSSLRDYTNGAKTYNGHRGIDIDVPSFRAMDNDFPVNAAASGRVIAVVDGNPDRNLACVSNNANYVRVLQDDCSVGWYAHLKRNSMVVAVGDRVAAGQKLAVVGSSGCSTAPHLHYELNASSGALEEPFATGRWLSPPVYATPLGIMDVNFKSGAFSTFPEVQDPPPDPTHISPGTLGMSANCGGGGAGDTVNFRLINPSGTIASQSTITLSQSYRHSFWWTTGTVTNTAGTWRVEVRANGGTPVVRTFLVP